jgi:Superinfection immunity protein
MKPAVALGIGVVGVFVVGYIYFLPTIVARRRRHNNARAIFIMNLLLPNIRWLGRRAYLGKHERRSTTA